MGVAVVVVVAFCPSIVTFTFADGDDDDVDDDNGSYSVDDDYDIAVADCCPSVRVACKKGRFQHGSWGVPVSSLSCDPLGSLGSRWEVSPGTCLHTVLVVIVPNTAVKATCLGR